MFVVARLFVCLGCLGLLCDWFGCLLECDLFVMGGLGLLGLMVCWMLCLVWIFIVVCCRFGLLVGC